MPRKPFTMLLSASLTLGWALALAGCKPDICKDPTLPTADRCSKCTPKKSNDDEVLARLDPTQLPWPVRKNIEDCIAQHEGDLFLTKQGLRECIEADGNLDTPTKLAVVDLINHSNVMEQADLEAFHANCSAINLAPPIMTIPSTMPTVPPPRLDPPEMAPPPAFGTQPPPPSAGPPSRAPASPAVRPTMTPTSRPLPPPPPAPAPSDPLL